MVPPLHLHHPAAAVVPVLLLGLLLLRARTAARRARLPPARRRAVGTVGGQLRGVLRRAAVLRRGALRRGVVVLLLRVRVHPVLHRQPHLHLLPVDGHRLRLTHHLTLLRVVISHSSHLRPGCASLRPLRHRRVRFDGQSAPALLRSFPLLRRAHLRLGLRRPPGLLPAPLRRGGLLPAPLRAGAALRSRGAALGGAPGFGDARLLLFVENRGGRPRRLSLSARSSLAELSPLLS